MIPKRLHLQSPPTLLAIFVTALLTVACTRDCMKPGAVDLGQDTRLQPRRVLIITGGDYPGHDWRRTTPVLAAAVGEDARLKVDVLDDLSLLGEKDLSRYAALILHFKNYDASVPGRRGFDNITDFVDGGIFIIVFCVTGGWYAPNPQIPAACPMRSGKSRLSRTQYAINV